MRAYALLLLKTCHKRGAPAIGGMSALIPIKNDPEERQGHGRHHQRQAPRRHRRLRRRLGGAPGPGRGDEEFVKVLGDKPNQFDKQRPDVEVKGPTC
jgi:malate synthase